MTASELLRGLSVNWGSTLPELEAWEPAVAALPELIAVVEAAEGLMAYADFLDESAPRFTHGADAILEETAKSLRHKLAPLTALTAKLTPKED